MSDGKVHVEFGWAAVVENPNHPATNQPYVYVAVKDLTKSTTLYSQFIFAGDGSIWNDVPNSADAIQYTNWQVIDVAPGAAGLAVGDQVSIEVTAAGCSQGGHWGYVYVDHFGSFQPVTAHVSAADKVYDGTTAATLTGGSLTGVQGSDDVSLNTAGATATFDSASPGVGKTVTVSGLALSGADADKYMLVSNTATTAADITSAADVVLQAGALDLKPGHTTTVTATATDGSGNPVSGELITFAATGGSVSPLTAFTDANGVATATFTAGGTSGPATVTATAYGSAQDSADLYVDGVAPTTTASNTQAASGTGWVDQGVAVTLTMSDDSPDAGTTYYRLDTPSGSPTLFTGAPIAVDGQGIHTLEFWSVDAAGNEETPHETRYVNIDTTAPVVTSSADGATQWTDQPVTVTLDASDSGGSHLSSVQYRLDGSATWLDAAGDQFTVPAPTNGGNDGAHLCDYRAVDNAGNETDGTCTVGIDTTPPVTNVSVDHDAATGDVTVAFLPTDLASGMVGGLAKTEYQVEAVPGSAAPRSICRLWSTTAPTGRTRCSTARPTSRGRSRRCVA
ncbi:MAG TPA: YDG domain-containing protein [Thermoleophilia bacterium]|nr:YDG domain-containing protein [Thermoleophilia bacterium]